MPQLRSARSCAKRSAKVSLMCMFGVGVPLAVLIDATLVRMLLMPAFMRILGPLNWWAPGPLARLHRRFAISEAGELPELVRPGQATTRNGSPTRPAAAASVGAIETVDYAFEAGAGMRR